MNVVRGEMTVTRDSIYFAYLFMLDMDGSEAVKANVRCTSLDPAEICRQDSAPVQSEFGCDAQLTVCDANLTNHRHISQPNGKYFTAATRCNEERFIVCAMATCATEINVRCHV